MPTYREERGDIVLGWLTRVVLVLTLLGVSGFDFIAVVAGHFTTEDHANEAATVASQSWLQFHDLNAAYQAAKDAAEAHGDHLTGPMTIDPDGTVHLTVAHHVKTLLVSHIGPLRHYGDAEATVAVRSNTP